MALVSLLVCICRSVVGFGGVVVDAVRNKKSLGKVRQVGQDQVGKEEGEAHA